MREAPSASAFFDAIKAGELDRVKAMVSADPSLVDARNAEGSAILTAVYHRQKEIVNLLVARGAALSLFEAATAASGGCEQQPRFDADADRAGRRRECEEQRRPDAADARRTEKP